MRKLLLAVVMGATLVVMMAAPAFAIRDPFDPTIDLTPETASAGGDTGAQVDTGDTGDGGATVDGQVDDVGSEGLAATGADTEPWLVAAYGLIVAGAAAVALSKNFSTVPS
jgi:hypothetical protein